MKYAVRLWRCKGEEMNMWCWGDNATGPMLFDTMEEARMYADDMTFLNRYGDYRAEEYVP